MLYSGEGVEQIGTSGSGGSGGHRGTGKRNGSHFLQLCREQKPEDIPRYLQESDLGPSYAELFGDAGANGFRRFTRNLNPWKLFCFRHHRRSMHVQEVTSKVTNGTRSGCDWGFWGFRPVLEYPRKT